MGVGASVRQPGRQCPLSGEELRGGGPGHCAYWVHLIRPLENNMLKLVKEDCAPKTVDSKCCGIIIKSTY